MPSYQFQAVDQQGHTQSGLMFGANFEAVNQQLSDKGWTVQSLSLASGGVHDPLAAAPTRPVATAESARSSYGQATEAPPLGPRSRVVTDVVGPLVGGVALTHLNFFFRQLGAMLHAGIDPRQALDTLSQQAGSPKLRSILRETMAHVEAGRPMSAGFQRYPEVFSPIMMGMVRAGEEGGFLSDQCTRLAHYIQNDIELRNLIRRETFYPKLVLGASVIIIIGTNLLINFLKPGAKGLDAPVMIWVIVAILAICGFLFSRLLLRQPAIKRPWDEITVALPWIGGMVHGFAMAKFGRAFGAMQEAGLPLSRAVNLAADACGNEAVRARIYPIVPRMDSGEGIHHMFRETKAFSPVVLDMVQAGEMTGNINEMLVKVSEYYEDEGKTRARQAAMILGAATLMLVGAYVAYVVISFYMGYAADRTQEV